MRSVPGAVATGSLFDLESFAALNATAPGADLIAITKINIEL